MLVATCFNLSYCLQLCCWICFTAWLWCVVFCSAYVGVGGTKGAGDATIRFQTIEQHQVVTIGDSEPVYNGVVLKRQPPPESVYNVAESTIFANEVSDNKVPQNQSNSHTYHVIEVRKSVQSPWSVPSPL